MDNVSSWTSSAEIPDPFSFLTSSDKSMPRSNKSFDIVNSGSSFLPAGISKSDAEGSGEEYDGSKCIFSPPILVGALSVERPREDVCDCGCKFCSAISFKIFAASASALAASAFAFSASFKAAFASAAAFKAAFSSSAAFAALNADSSIFHSTGLATISLSTIKRKSSPVFSLSGITTVSNPSPANLEAGL